MGGGDDAVAPITDNDSGEARATSSAVDESLASSQSQTALASTPDVQYKCQSKGCDFVFVGDAHRTGEDATCPRCKVEQRLGHTGV